MLTNLMRSVCLVVRKHNILRLSRVPLSFSAALPPCALLCVLAGKTTVARVLARLLAMVGVLPCAKVVEVQRTDLVGEFVGHTGPKTRKKVRRGAVRHLESVRGPYKDKDEEEG